MSDALPKGWIAVELKTHVYIAGRIGWRGLKRSEYTRSGPRFLAVKNILPDGKIDFDDTDHLSQERYNESPEIQLRRNDVLLTKDGTIGKVGMVDALSGPTTVNSSILVVRPNDELIFDRYLFHYLRGPKFQEIARERITGSAIPHLFQKDIKKLEALVPPLAEQKRIVAKLEKLLEKVDASRARLDKIPRLLKRFRQSVLAAACSGKLTADWREGDANTDDLPNCWAKCQLNDICELITKGASPKWQGVNYAKSGVLFVTSKNVGQGKMLLDTKKYVESKINEIQPRSILKMGDLLTNIVGASIGRTAIFDSNEIANINQAVALIRLKSDVDRQYILHVLNSPTLTGHMDKEKVDVARANLSLKDVAGFPIQLPPLPEQQEIVKRVEELFGLADRLEARYTKAKTQVDRLTQSILAKAFRGELVPQDPTDEPASVLLARIREKSCT